MQLLQRLLLRRFAAHTYETRADRVAKADGKPASAGRSKRRNLSRLAAGRRAALKGWLFCDVHITAIILLSGMASAQSLPSPASFVPGTQVASYAGLGDGGFALSGSFAMSPTSPAARFWVITGANPSSEFLVEIDLRAIEGRHANGNYLRANCTAQAAWTMPEYANGLPIPEWPEVFFDWAAYNVLTGTKTLRGHVHAPGLQPFSNYSVDVVCAPRLQ